MFRQKLPYRCCPGRKGIDLLGIGSRGEGDGRDTDDEGGWGKTTVVRLIFFFDLVGAIGTGYKVVGAGGDAGGDGDIHLLGGVCQGSKALDGVLAGEKLCPYL